MTRPPHDAVEAARGEIVRVGTSLFARGYVHASAGNISARLDDSHLITPTDAALGFLDPKRLALVDGSGEQLSGDPASKTLEEKAVVERALAEDAAHRTVHGRVLDAFREPKVWLMCVIYFFFVMGQYALTFWMPTFVESTGIEGGLAIGALSAVPYLAALVAMNLFGRSSDLRRERRRHLVVPSLMGAVGFSLAAGWTGSTALSLVALSVAAAGVLTCAPLFWSLPTAFLGGTAAAAGLAVINSVGNLAGFVSPYMIGALKDATGSTAIPMYVLAVGLVLGAAAVLTTDKKSVNR